MTHPLRQGSLDTSMPIWWNDIRASIIQLASQRDANSNQQNTARSLLLHKEPSSSAAPSRGGSL